MCVCWCRRFFNSSLRGELSVRRRVPVPAPGQQLEEVSSTPVELSRLSFLFFLCFLCPVCFLYRRGYTSSGERGGCLCVRMLCEARGGCVHLKMFDR